MSRNALKIIFLIGAGFGIFSCSSEPTKGKRPEWVDEPARIVDGGYIVYVAQGTGPTKEKAQFRAEGVALEDLANECSFLPKGTRIEDRYSEMTSDGKFFAAVKVGLEFKDCEAAQKIEEPEKIKDKASLAFTEQLKRFQDIEETGATVADTAPVIPPSEASSVPAQQVGMSDQTYFYGVRQYVVYQKQMVILAPPGYYVPGSPAYNSYSQSMATANPIIIHYVNTYPEFGRSTQPPPLTAVQGFVPRPQNLLPPAARASSQGLGPALPRPSPLNSGPPQSATGNSVEKPRERSEEPEHPHSEPLREIGTRPDPVSERGVPREASQEIDTHPAQGGSRPGALRGSAPAQYEARETLRAQNSAARPGAKKRRPHREHQQAPPPPKKRKPPQK